MYKITNCCSRISPSPSLHSTSLHLRNLHILTTIYLSSLHFTKPLFFYQVAPQLYSRGWVDPVPGSLLFFWWCRESNPDLRICSQELWPLDHRGDLTNYTNISTRSGSIDIADGKLNTALSALEPWFQKWRTKVNIKNAHLHFFSNDCVTITAVRVL
jgi:hypothetical protein